MLPKIFLLLFILNCTTCAEDPLKFLKEYYNSHNEVHEADIPVVENFDTFYDFVIIGSGSGGSVMANRLSEITNWKILLLEAGEQGDFLTDIPLLDRLVYRNKYDWNYTTEVQTKCSLSSGGKYSYPRGKALGGTSVIYGMLYMRGNKQNFDDWEALENPNWNYNSILKYFKKSEDVHIKSLETSFYHSTKGPLSVNYANYNTGFNTTVIDAGRELGYDIVDYNGAKQIGFAIPQFNTLRGRKCSAAKCFLKPVASRKNLSIATGALVSKININKQTQQVKGVHFTKNNKTYYVRVKKEVILSAGTVNSPQILMLSGIGPKAHLDLLDIPVIKNLNVGYNLRDQAGIILSRFNISIENKLNLNALSDEEIISDYFQNGKGPLTLPMGNEGLASLKTKLAEFADVPDIELGLSVVNNKLTIMAMAFNPKSAGRIKLKSKNITDAPIINTNCFNYIEDVHVVIEGIKLVSLF